MRKKIPFFLIIIFFQVFFSSTLANNNNNNKNNSVNEKSKENSEYPPFLSEKVQKNGGIILAFMIAIYCFTLLAIVCDKYFIPSIERMCDILNISADVAAATFMSVATSCPELFTNLFATFLLGNNLGIGTVVGSSMFNALGVASAGALAAIHPIKLDWWPVTRDVTIYMFSISILIAIAYDGRIYWYESLILFICYFLYFIVLFQNGRMSKFVRKKFDRSNAQNPEENCQKIDRDSVRVSVASAFGTYSAQARQKAYENPHEMAAQREIQEIQEKLEYKKSPFRLPPGAGWWTKIVFIYLWPVKMALRLTVPNPKLHGHLWAFTFVLCIIWIAANSYVVSWMATLIGACFRIPSSVQGLTFVAAGGSLPECLSIVIMTRRGEGKMGVSNSLGANSMNILFSLGMPWFFRTLLMMHKDGAAAAFLTIDSSGIVYSIIGLLFVAVILYVTLALAQFTLSKRIGVILVSIYLVFIVCACVMETVIFPAQL